MNQISSESVQLFERRHSGIKAISKCEVNPTSGFQDIAFTSNCGRTYGWLDRQTNRAIRYYVPYFNRRIKSKDVHNNKDPNDNRGHKVIASHTRSLSVTKKLTSDDRC